jgi:S1-C subfamily serine protease
MSRWSIRAAAVVAIAGLLSAPVFAADPAPASGKAYLGIAAEGSVPGQPGILVGVVGPDSPAAKAGLKEGDRIVMAGDRRVKSVDDLKDALAGQIPGDKLALKVVRDGKEQSVTVALGKEPAPQARTPEPAQQPGAYLGVFTQPLKAAMKDRLGIKVEKGALVARVMPGSPAAKAGLTELDVVTRIGDTEVNGPLDLRQAVEKAGAGKEVTLQVVRGDKTLSLKARLAEEASPAPIGREGWMAEQPDGFGRFQNPLPSFFSDREKVTALERKVQELEKRIEQLERSQAKPAR